MGNIGGKPIIEKHILFVEGNGLYAGLSAMQGYRPTMEDAHSLIPNFNDHNCSFYAVFDGHGGDYVSNYAAEHMPIILQSQSEYMQNPVDPELISNALQRAYLDFDIQVRVTDPICTGIDHSGSTAVSVYVTPNYIICANAGDSRACLYSGTDVINLSFDHKPYNDSERIRIMEAGGSVVNKRVNGDLAVSRCLGDFTFKLRSDTSPIKQMVTPLPDIIIHERSKQDKFVIIACDGVWDVMTNEEACEYIAQDLLYEKDITTVSCNVVNECLNRGSRDNISVLIICFPNAPKPIQRHVDERERERKNGSRPREKYI